jgi:hypothetical protein
MKTKCNGKLSLQVLTIMLLIVFTLLAMVSLFRGLYDDYELPENDIRTTECVLGLLGGGAHLYHRKFGSCPTNEYTFVRDLTNAAIRIQTHESLPPFCDYWGMRLKYRTSNDVAILTSSGPDRVYGNADDIVRTQFWHGSTSPLSFYEGWAEASPSK